MLLPTGLDINNIQGALQDHNMAGPRPDDQYNPVPTQAPSLAAPNDFLGVRAEPNEFGAQIGQATQKFGANVSDVADKTTQLAIQYQQIAGQTLANQQSNAFADYASQMDNELHAKQGLNATAYLPQYQKALSDKLNELGNNIPGVIPRQQFFQDARNFYNRSISGAGIYVGDEAKKAYSETLGAKIQSAVDTGVMNWRVPGATDQSIQDIKKTTVDKALFEGITDQDAINHRVSAATGELITNTFLSRISQDGTPDQMVQNFKDAWSWLQGYVGKTIPNSPNTPIIDGPQQARLTQEALSRQFYINSKAEAYDVKNSVANYMGNVSRLYHTAIGQPETSTSPFNIGNVKSGGSFANPSSPEDGANLAATNLRKNYQGLTLQQIGQKWTNDNPSDLQHWLANVKSVTGLNPDAIPNLNDRASLVSLIHGIGVAEKNKSDLSNFNDQNIGVGVDAALSGKPAALAAAGLKPLNTVSGNYQREGDYLEQNFGQVENEIASQAAKDYPEDPGKQMSIVNGVRTQMYNIIKDMKTQDSYNYQNVAGYIMGNNPSKTLITSEQQMEQAPQAIKDAWESIRTNNGQLYSNLKDKLIQANTHGNAVGLGSDFWQSYTDVMSGKVTDTTTLANDIGWGKTAALTNSGYWALKGLQDRSQTPGGVGFNQAELNFFKSVRHQMTGTDLSPGAHDPDGDEELNKTMASLLPIIEKRRESGEGIEMFDPNKQGYVGNGIKYPTVKDINERMQRRIMHPADFFGGSNQQAALGAPVDFKDFSSLGIAYKTKKIDKSTFLKFGRTLDKPYTFGPGIPNTGGGQ